MMNPFRQDPKGYQRTPVLASIPTARTSGTVSTLRLFDPIDSWGGEWGVSAKEFVAAIDALPDDTTEIRVLINSPGGMVYEGIAIMNALRSHDATVVAVVEGIAASAASFIAASADELVMMKNSELFIHNAWGYVVGDAADMREAAVDLDHFDLNIANIYAAKSGDDDAERWLAEMHRNRYLTADEAVAEGLADRIEGEGDAVAARAKFDLSAFARHPKAEAVFAASPPKPPVSAEPGEPNRKDVTVSDTIKAGLAQRLGITEAAAANLSDEDYFAALDQALTERAEPEATSAALPAGAVAIDAGVLADLQSNAAAGVTALAQQTAERRDRIVHAALTEGRISAAHSTMWRAQLDTDEAGISAMLAAFPANGAVPVAPIGKDDVVNVDTAATDRAYAAVYPPAPAATEKGA